MANNFDDEFSYDNNDPELDENGLPIEKSDSSLENLMNMITNARDNLSDINNSDNTPIANSNNSREEGNTELDDKNSADSESDSTNEYQEPETFEEKTQNNLLNTKLIASEAKLKTILTQLKTNPNPTTPLILTPSQSATLKDAKSLVEDKHCNDFHPIKTRRIKSLIRKIDLRVFALRASYWIQKLWPILPYIGIALLIILAVVLVVVLVVSIVSFFQSKTDPANMTSNSCITSEFFYGTRSVYIDEDLLINSLQFSYKQYVVDILENIETENPDITINITLPEEFDNSTEINNNITNISLGIANIVATGSNNYSGIEFSTLYPQIEYFGLTSEQGETVTDFITQYFTDNEIITLPDGESMDNIVENSTSHENLQYIYNRCEKVMIKDELSTESGVNGLQQRQYIASIYMPNKDIVIDSSIYIIASENETFTANSKLIEQNNGTETIHNEKETADNSDIINGFAVGKVNLSTFTSIDQNNTTAFSNGLSLFEAMRLSPDYINYFTLNTETNVYTWKPTATSYLYFTFDASDSFIFTDFSLNVKNP